ncbi:MAG: hypothetical protein COZ31_04950 [Nitrospirae bacterium CG_4_10_14_3_um_filter_44_29]|nr:MAG: hypothetical protein COZ31_04950 [Nitrospirae bacterium CG_4_10_14_3_um_filter_44_29]HCJ52025.1 hypothetical protein [Gallionella sp.]
MNMIRLIGMIVLSTWIYGCGQRPAEPPTPQMAPPNVAAEPPQTAAEPVEAAPPVAAPAAPATTHVYEYRNGGMYKAVPAEAELFVKAEQQEKLMRAAPKGASPAERAAVGIEHAPVARGPAVVTKAEESGLFHYATKIFATKKFMKFLGPIKASGELIVWIGQAGNEPEDQSEMVSKSQTLAPTSTKAVSAKITPTYDSSAFDVKPAESACQKVEPNGTEVPFTITPKMSGTFRVGAKVELYGKAECAGEVVTRTPHPITVIVNVGIPWQELWDEIWVANINLVKGLLAICVAALLFFFRKKIFPFMKDSEAK